MIHRCRELQHAARPGDLKEVAAGEAPPTLRLYSWAPPALSIGRFQKANTVADLESCRRLGLDIVRRPTGGGRYSITRS